MRTTIDHGGRVVVPKPWRDLLGFVAGSPVEVELDGASGAVVIRPAGAAARLVTEDGLVVIRSEASEETPTTDDIRDVLEATRDRRL